MRGSLRVAAFLSAALASTAGAFIITPGGQNNGTGWLHYQNIPGSITDPVSGVVYTVTDAAGPNQMERLLWFHRMGGPIGDQPREVGYGNGASPTGVSSSGFFVGDLTGNSHSGGMDFFTFDGVTGAQTGSQQRYMMRRPANLIAGVEACNIITNNGQDLLEAEIFAVVDMSLSSSPGDDSVSLGREFELFQHDGAGGTPPAKVIAYTGLRGETNFLAPIAMQADLDGSIFASLTDDGITMLDNTVAEGMGNVSIAFQWSFTLNPGESAALGFEFGFVPEPGPVALLACGAIAALRRRR